MSRIEEDKRTVRQMVEIYCHGNHHTREGLCEECRALLEYSHFPNSVYGELPSPINRSQAASGTNVSSENCMPNWPLRPIPTNNSSPVIVYGSSNLILFHAPRTTWNGCFTR